MVCKIVNNLIEVTMHGEGEQLVNTYPTLPQSGLETLDAQ